MEDFILVGIYMDEGVKSIKLVLDETFGSKSHFCHERTFGKEGARWRYRHSTQTVYWYENQTEEVQNSVDDHIKKKYTSENPTTHKKMHGGSPSWHVCHYINQKNK